MSRRFIYPGRRGRLFVRAGYYLIRCVVCDVTLSSNGLGRASHERSTKHCANLRRLGMEEYAPQARREQQGS